ncbi:glycosyltransferase [Bacteroides sp. 214]|uniref:glycosyltransferase n=1 Tax=Bacteroides sp. 214 TaxID=2302935 RepID=UPI0013D819F5|nr:glycosyltransferase family 2 protein [Bacteroides sp. 214]NDW13437.1 glycosyltransferase [Bacteroides sp. 214]
METIIQVVDYILYFCMGITVLYLFIFAVASKFKRKNKYPKTDNLHRYAVLFPSYNEDKVILESVTTFLRQTYPADKYDVIVISDHMTEKTDNELREAGATVLKATYQDSSKAKALQLAMNSLDETLYDGVVIMDSDNIAGSSFLHDVNKAFDKGCQAIQTHRTAKNKNTNTAMLDAASEEINNSIFRRGHVNIGLSSALIGSGMVFDYHWFKKNILTVSTAGEDKELEALLLKQKIFIEYLEQVHVYDEKIAKDDAFYNQRRRWLAANYGILAHTFADLPKAIFTGNWSYCDKIFQWMQLPRVILLVGIGFLSCLITLYSWQMSLKWWSLLLFLMVTLVIAIPNYLMNKELLRSVCKVPKLGFLMFLNLFRLRGVNKKFIHTDHE